MAGRGNQGGRFAGRFGGAGRGEQFHRQEQGRRFVHPPQQGKNLPMQQMGGPAPQRQISGSLPHLQSQQRDQFSGTTAVRPPMHQNYPSHQSRNSYGGYQDMRQSQLHQRPTRNVQAGSQSQTQNQVFPQKIAQDTSQGLNVQHRMIPDLDQSADQHGEAQGVMVDQPQQQCPQYPIGMRTEVVSTLDPIVSHHSSAVPEADVSTVFATSDSKFTCYKCWGKGHILKDCPNQVSCNVCGKDSHISSRCAWLRQPKPAAKFVGYAAAGLGCFVVEHARDLVPEDKNNSMALVTVVSGNLNASQLAHDFELTFPWKWEWVARDNGPGTFLMKFPSVARIGEVSPFSSVTLRGSGAQISVSRWTPETMAAGKLHLVWIRVNGVPDTMKNYHALCEIGSSVGIVQEVDMDLLESHDLVRIKVGVKDPCKIPFKSEVITPKMLLYDVYFKVESVVQIGWCREVSKKNAELCVEDKVLGAESEILTVRDAKRQKSLSNELLLNKDLGKELRVEKDNVSIQGDTNYVVGTSAKKVPIQHNVEINLEQKLLSQEDAVLVQTDKDGTKMNDQEDNTMLGSQEKVQLSGSEGIEEYGTQESDPDYFTKQVGVVVADSQEIDSFEEGPGQHQGSLQFINPRRSSRLKDSEEVNVIDKAKERAKTKDLEKGKGGRSGYALQGR